jgi:hypothetical protein
MKYFFDTEFIEDSRRPIGILPSIGKFNRKIHTIDLVSIGIIDEDGREFYALSKDFNPFKANTFVKLNVFPHIVHRYIQSTHGVKRELSLNCLEGKSIEAQISHIQRWQGKHNSQIASEVFNFINPGLGWPISSYNNSEMGDDGPYYEHFSKHRVTVIKGHYYAQPEFYAYYSDYDWVLLCSLYGNLSDLPPGFPKYCKDLEQAMDSLNAKISESIAHPQEHHALEDAKWNRELYRQLLRFSQSKPELSGISL